jgi:virginiamycin B lyase
VTRRLAAAAALVLGLAGWAGTSSARAQGGFEEFPVPNAAGGIVAGPDGDLWFTEPANQAIGEIGTSGSLTEHPINDVASAPDRITVGPDGALWASDNAGPIRRIATNGQVTSFPTPNQSATHGITRGPDEQVWYTARDANLVGRMTTAGLAQDFPLPGAGRQPDGIVAGADGALWFTQRGANAIGRMTTDGTFTEFALPTPNAGPRGIAPGPDGALWFTEHDAHQIGRITTGGQITEFALAPDAAPREIRAAADGALWYTDEQRSVLGRITTGGVIGEFPLPSAGPADGLTQGPSQGDVWYTRGQLVGHHGLGAPTGALPPPVLGRSVDVVPVSGTVLVKEKGSSRFVSLAAGGANIPTGSTVDTTNGRVRLTSATTSAGTQTGDFRDGRFVVRQSTRASLTTNALTGPLNGCGRRRGRAGAARKPKKGRRLWGNASGAFRTSGHRAAATVRGTVWSVTDRCDGSTAVTVFEGAVTVEDLVRDLRFTVRAGQTYVARPRRRG